MATAPIENRKARVARPKRTAQISCVAKTKASLIDMRMVRLLDRHRYTGSSILSSVARLFLITRRKSQGGTCECSGGRSAPGAAGGRQALEQEVGGRESRRSSRLVESVVFWPLPIWFFAALYVAIWIYALALWWLVPAGRRSPTT